MPIELVTTLQILAGVITAALFVVSFDQAKSVRKQVAILDMNQEANRQRFEAQVEQEQRRTQQQNAFLIIDYVERPSHLAARKAVGALADKPFESWDEADRANADVVWRLWTVAGFYQYLYEVLPPRFLHLYWGNSIVWHWKILTPYIDELRKVRGIGQAQSFEQIRNEVEALGWFKDGRDLRPTHYFSGLPDPGTDDPQDLTNAEPTPDREPRRPSGLIARIMSRGSRHR